LKNLFFTIIILLFILVAGLDAQEIKNITLKNTNNKIYVSAYLDEDIPEEVFEYLHNGVKVTIVYEIKLYAKRPFFFLTDSRIKSITYKKNVKYNMWEKVYVLVEEHHKEKIAAQNEINARLKKIENIFLATMDDIKGEDDCYVKIKASLESVKLFPPLSWIFDVVSKRGFETSWESKDIK